MKRLTAYLKGKIEEIKVSNREKRIMSALDAAKLNFEDAIMDADLKIDSLTEKLGSTEDVNKIIQEISDLIGNKEDAQKGLERIETIKKYFNEEVKNNE